MRIRTTIACVLVFAPFLFAVSHVVVFSHRRSRMEEAHQTARTLIDNTQRLMHHPGWDKGFTELFSAPKVKNLRIGALMVDAGGNVVWRSPNDAPAWPRPTPDPATIVDRGHFTLYLEKPTSAGLEPVELQTLLSLSAGVLAAFAIGAWLVVGWTLSPIRSLARQAASAGVDGPSTRLANPSQDSEITELVSTLNGLLGRIEESSAEQGRFYAAASHELRTPLQALLGHLEVALGQPRTEEEYAVTLQEAQVQTRRLVSLVEGILLLHQLQGPATKAPEVANLSKETSEHLEMLRPLIEARNLDLQIDVQTDVTVPAIPTHVSVLVRNLLENAAKYGREGGVLRVVLAKADKSAHLRIENEAPEGSAMEAERLFEPFYRLDASRSAKSGGNGLGLAICKAVVKANGWALSLTQQGPRVVAQVEFH